MKREYLEIRVQTTVDAGELLGLLDEAGSLGACEESDGVRLYWQKERWGAATLEALQRALRILGDVHAWHSLTIADLPDQDWNARWVESLQPILLGRRILVRQSWNSAAVPPGGFELVIDPKRAFGTGYHATTQLVATWLEEVIRGGERLLDVGTGSGILCMVGLRLGASSALGIDNDPEAIECAAEYAAVNGFGSELELRVATPEDLIPEEFDVIVANLDRKTLLRYFPVFGKHLRPRGTLFTSGLQSEDYPEILEALAGAGWAVRGRRDRDEWMALELQIGT